jgi:hypothetical protein
MQSKAKKASKPIQPKHNGWLYEPPKEKPVHLPLTPLTEGVRPGAMVTAAYENEEGQLVEYYGVVLYMKVSGFNVDGFGGQRGLLVKGPSAKDSVFVEEFTAWVLFIYPPEADMPPELCAINMNTGYDWISKAFVRFIRPSTTEELINVASWFPLNLDELGQSVATVSGGLPETNRRKH